MTGFPTGMAPRSRSETETETEAVTGKNEPAMEPRRPATLAVFPLSAAPFRA
jgi:hypothetical protein